MDGHGIGTGVPLVPTNPRRCAPVREAVDPAKYVSIQEGDVTKFACSKCGNVYKWKKSLNKHWKEKHEGEVPRGPPAIPRIQASATFTPATRPHVQELHPVVMQPPPTSPRPSYRKQSPPTSTRCSLDSPPPAHIRCASASCQEVGQDTVMDLSQAVTPQTEPLDLSMKVVTKHEEAYQCQRCSQEFYSMDGLNQHFLVKHGACLSVALYQADTQLEAAPDSVTKSGIYATLMNETPRVIHCVVCGVSYMWVWAMEKHFQDAHPAMKNPYQRPPKYVLPDDHSNICK